MTVSIEREMDKLRWNQILRLSAGGGAGLHDTIRVVRGQAVG